MSNIIPNKPDGHEHFKATGELQSIEDKIRILEELGHHDAVETFKKFKPRKSRAKVTAPLSQRMNLIISKTERVALEQELKSIKASSPNSSVSLAGIVRSKALNQVDINEWARRAEEGLRELKELKDSQAQLLKERRSHMLSIEEYTEYGQSVDPEAVGFHERALSELNQKLGKLKVQSKKREVRLSGRTTLVESETIRHRANRLCIPASDYIRFMLFDYLPNSDADAHLSLEVRVRFYASILDVQKNGWGSVSTVYQCPQCGHYVEEIERLKERVKQLENFAM